MIIGIHGDLGSGKTAIMTLLAYFFYKNGYKVMSNYGLKFPHETIDVNNVEDNYNYVVCIDEMTTILDGRNSSSAFNKDFSYFVLQSRKRNIILIYTAQFKDSVDKRLRNLQDYIIYCIKRNSKLYYYLMPSSETSVKRASILLKSIIPTLKKLYDTNEIIKPINLKRISEKK